MRENLQSLLGFLFFTTKIVVLRQAFFRHLFIVLEEFKQIYYIDMEKKGDLR